MGHVDQWQPFAERIGRKAGRDAVKNLAHPSFFRVFDLLLGTTNPGLKLSSWSHNGVSWERERHSFTGPTHGQTIEIFMLRRNGKRGWSVMVVKEYWWVGKESKPVKTVRWAKPIEGQRADILTWFRAEEAGLDRGLFVREKATASRAEYDHTLETASYEINE
jgi:hypothetical protein